MDVQMEFNISKKILIFYLFLFQTACVNVPSLIIVDDETNLSSALQTNNVRHIGQYKILNLEDRCKLKTCPVSTQDTKDYYNYCFQEHCAYGSFHCINGSGKVITFCAQFKDCDLRNRHIAVINKQRPEYVDVYEIPCEVGFFQRNDQHSCFEACVKDTSITLLESEVNSTQSAYCKPGIGCNAFGKMFFEVGSRYDDCTGSDQCPGSLDILPDCSCAEPCLPNFERKPENNFACSLRNESTNAADTSNGESSQPVTKLTEEFEEITETEVNASTSVTDEVKVDKNEDTSSTLDHSEREIDDMVDPKDTNNVEGGNSSPYVNVLMIILVSVACIAGFVSAVFLVVRRRFKRPTQYNAIRSNHVCTKDDIEADRQDLDERGTSVTFKTINDSSTTHNFNIEKADTINIRTCSHRTDSRHERDSTCTTTMPEEQKMALLKEQDVNGDDTSVTEAKELYS